MNIQTSFLNHRFTDRMVNMFFCRQANTRSGIRASLSISSRQQNLMFPVELTRLKLRLSFAVGSTSRSWDTTVLTIIFMLPDVRITKVLRKMYVQRTCGVRYLVRT